MLLGLCDLHGKKLNIFSKMNKIDKTKENKKNGPPWSRTKKQIPFEQKKTCSTRLPRGHQVDGLPRASSNSGAVAS